MDSSKNILQIIQEYSFPYYRHTYYTKLSALEIRERLLKHLDTKEQPLLSTIFGSRASQKYAYQGKFEGGFF